jgi:hypothetical protein
LLPFDELPRDDDLPLREELRPPDGELPLDDPLPLDDRRLLEARLPPDDRLRLEDERFELADGRLRDPPLLRRELEDDERCFFTSPSSIVPRHSPGSSSSIRTYALNRAMSARTARFTWRMPRAAFSISEPGWTSRLTSMRVRFGASSWKVTTPACVTPSFTRHLIRLSGRCSTISALNSFEIPQIFVLKVTWDSSSWLTESRRCMNSGQSSNWVHWL